MKKDSFRNDFIITANIVFMDYAEAINLLKENITNEKLIKHCIAVGAIMEKLAEYFNEDKEKWKLCGLLHDIDYEKTMDNMEKHGILAEDILRDKVDEEIINAIKSHNDKTGFKPISKMAKALIAADLVSGLIIATALVMPNKTLEEVKLESLKSKFKQKDFARRIDRDKIREMCGELNIELDTFLELSLNALKEVRSDLGL